MSDQPPLKAMLAFDAAMQSNSFAIAAKNLSVTPGAISQQIQKLEDWLGCPLFIRETRQIRPTAEAIAYWAVVQPALASIQRASHTLRHQQSNEVWLSLPPTLAAKWFAPRMTDLLSSHPEISLHLLASTTLVDFNRETIDLAIRYFDGNDAALDATLLFTDEARLYCSPSYCARLGLKEAAHLLHATLLHSTLHPHWPAWLEQFAGIAPSQSDTLPGLYFNQTLLAIEAAKHSRGVVLCSALLVEEEVRQGQLIEPFPYALPLSQAYYLVHTHQQALRPATKILKKWLMEIAEGNG